MALSRLKGVFELSGGKTEKEKKKKKERKR